MFTRDNTARRAACATLLAGAFFFLLRAAVALGWPTGPVMVATEPEVAAVVRPQAVTAGRATPRFKPIEQIRVGDRVHAVLPAGVTPDMPGRESPGEGAVDDAEFHPESWRVARLRLDDGRGLSARVELLRPLAWLESAGARPGARLPLHALEVGLSGEAVVEAILPCPRGAARASGDEQVVTGTIAQEGVQVWELTFAGRESSPLGVTARHPLHSADRWAWVEAGDLDLGESVTTSTGRSRLVSKTLRPGRHAVYNLEVRRAHAYYVSTGCLLAHNTGLPTGGVVLRDGGPTGVVQVAGGAQGGPGGFAFNTNTQPPPIAYANGGGTLGSWMSQMPMGQYPVLAPSGQTTSVLVPVIYREGRPSPSNLTPRPQDAGHLSFRDSLSNPVQPGIPGPLGGQRPVLRPGEDYIAIDTSRLSPGSVIPDGVPGSLTTPPGHVSVVNVPPGVLQDAVIPKSPTPPYGPGSSGKFSK